MPRLLPTLLRHAAHEDRRLALLLPICRDLRSARNELRWLRQHALQTGAGPKQAGRLLESYVKRRAGGEPLQYVLGTEFFGELQLHCRPGVLIPRPDTAVAVSHLVSLIRPSTIQGLLRKTVRVLDLCTGSGCIPLLFQHEFYQDRANYDTELAAVGLDISVTALSLAEKNRAAQVDLHRAHGNDRSPQLRALENMQFVRANVLRETHSHALEDVPSVEDALRGLPNAWTSTDILISNPPYISQHGFRTTTARSVRMYEPRLALVPPFQPNQDVQHDGDIFYPRLLALADVLLAKIVLFEVADMEQAVRVAAMCARRRTWHGVQIWRDEPGQKGVRSESLHCHGMAICVRGRGHGRSVLAYRESVADIFANAFTTSYAFERHRI